MVLGLDIGSMAISAVLLDSGGQLKGTFYEFHEGQIEKGLQNLSKTLKLNPETPLALTSSSRLSINGTENIDIQTALVKASHFPEQSPDYILHVGAEKFYLIKKGKNGNYESSRTSTSCAAGTGSFLDQQSRRLQIPSIEEFCIMAASNEGQVPEIASRCSVFAKTDLIHAQQEGHSAEAICDGLCKGLARNLTDTLFHDFKSGREILFTGGVSRNQVVVRYLEEILGARILIHPLSHLFGALGAGLFFLDGSGGTISLGGLTEHYAKPVNNREYFYPPLRPASESYPDFGEAELYFLKPGIRGFPGELQFEVFEDPGQLQPNGVYIGIDIGSTSTKAVICSDENIPVIGYYTYTSGKPIEAVFSILEAFDQYRKKHKWDPEILGVGTTGSGRKLAGKILNADLILDEITAHARAATHLEPEVDTIFEFGGKDYIGPSQQYNG